MRRDLWRLQEWERQRIRRAARAGGDPERPLGTAPRQDESAEPNRWRLSRERALEATVRRVSDSLSHLKHKSAALTDGPDRAAARAYMKGIGFDDEALASRRSASPTPGSRRCPATSTCAALAEHVKEGVRAAGGTPMEFNTIAISDGITMGTEGMKTSLVSREVIADSIELVARGYQFDAVVALSGCDKTIPGTRDGARPPRHPVA